MPKALLAILRMSLDSAVIGRNTVGAQLLDSPVEFAVFAEARADAAAGIFSVFILHILVGGRTEFIDGVVRA